MPHPLSHLPVKRKPMWDWTGFSPDLQVQQAWVNNWSQGTQVQLEFSEKYVTKCINSAIMEIETTELSMQAKMVRGLCHDSGIIPIQASLLA